MSCGGAGFLVVPLACFFGGSPWREKRDGVHQCREWDCSQVGDDLEEGDVMDWLEEDEMMKQCGDVSKEEKKITVKKWLEGKNL